MTAKSNVIPIAPDKREIATPYQPNPRELRTLQKQDERRRKSKSLPMLKLTGTQIAVDHKDNAIGFTLLMEAMGTAHADFALGLLGQLCNVADANRKGSEEQANFALAMVTGMEPRDQVEAMLASQMAAIQVTIMTYARRVALAEHLPTLESHEKSLNKLARTFTAQVEALKRYRSKGEQRVYVERVNVAQGGQAIVGNVAHGEGKVEK